MSKVYKSNYKSVLYAIGMVLIGWQLAHMSFQSFVIPNPLEVLTYTVQKVPVLGIHLLSSSYRILIGLILTILVGVTIGVGIGVSAWADRYITPIVYLFYPVPRIAFLPVFMILFGLGDASKIVLIFAISVFHLLVQVRDSIRNIPENLFVSARVMGLSKGQKLGYLVLPAILPALFTSLKMVLGSSIAALFFAENYATRQGIGYYIMNGWIKADYVEMYSGIIAISLFGMVLFKGIDLLEIKICKWK